MMVRKIRKIKKKNLIEQKK